MARRMVWPALCGELEKRFGELKPGEQLPAEQSLADELQVSKSTLRRALDVFVEQGILAKQPGKGNVLLRPPRRISRELVFLTSDPIFFAPALKSFCLRAVERNYYGTVVVLDGTAEMQRRLVMTVADRVPAGILINHTPALEEPEFFHRLERGKSTLLYMQRYPAGIERGNLIRISVAETFAEIVGRFYREGVRRFALYHCSGMAPGAVRERVDGFREGVRRCQLKVPEERIFLGPAGEAEQEAFFSLFRSCRRPDAVICVSDRSAAHFLAELRRRGIDRTGIRISGYDNSYLVNYAAPGIVTAAPPLEELGGAAVDLLIRQSENPGFLPKTIQLESQIIELN